MARSLRSEFQIPQDAKLALQIKVDASLEAADFLKRNAALIGLLVGGPEPLFLDPASGKSPGSIALAGRGFEIFIQIRELIDIQKLLVRFRKDIEREETFAQKLTSKLANQAFLDAAPAEIVQQERRKLDEAQSRSIILRRYVEDLS